MILLAAMSVKYIRLKCIVEINKLCCVQMISSQLLNPKIMGSYVLFGFYHESCIPGVILLQPDLSFSHIAVL